MARPLQLQLDLRTISENNVREGSRQAKRFRLCCNGLNPSTKVRRGIKPLGATIVGPKALEVVKLEMKLAFLRVCVAARKLTVGELYDTKHFDQLVIRRLNLSNPANQGTLQ